MKVDAKAHGNLVEKRNGEFREGVESKEPEAMLPFAKIPRLFLASALDKFTKMGNVGRGGNRKRGLSMVISIGSAGSCAVGGGGGSSKISSQRVGHLSPRSPLILGWCYCGRRELASVVSSLQVTC